MYKCMSPGAIGIRLEWDKCLPLAKAAGFEGIDVQADPSLSASHYKDALAAHGLRPGGAGLPFNFRGDQAEYDKGLSALPAMAKLSAQIGVTRFATWILSFSDSLTTQENIQFHVERLAPAAKILADSGCSLGLEFLGPKTLRAGHKYPFPRTMEHMLDLCAKVGKNVGLLLDSWHWFTSLGTIEDLLSLTPEQVVYVHINDAPAGLPVDQQVDSVRDLPGATGVQDLGGFLAALRAIGYEGPVVPEPFVPALAKMPPQEAASLVGAALGKVWSLPPRPILPAKMKVVATGRKKAWLVDQPIPRPQGHEVIVKIHASPICGSNMGGFLGDGEWINSGHEAAGEVVAVAQSNLLKVGDRVALAPLTACGQCPDCRRGDVIFCKHRPAVHGNFAQYTRVADVMCVPLPDDIDYVHGSLMGCCLGPPYESLKQVGVRAFDTVVINGLGPVGLGAVALATFIGARVLAIDPVPFRRNVALELGAEAALSPEDPQARQRVLDFTGPAGITKGVDYSGKEQGLRFLIDNAGIRARIGIVGENPGPFAISPSNDFIRKGLTLIGCWHMNVLDAGDLITFLRRAPQKADKLITHRFGFGDVQKAFDTFAGREAVKVILLPWE